MGIDYDGNMIVGAKESLINIPEDEDDWAYDNGMKTMSPYYDADPDDRYIGFKIENIPVKDIDDEWVKMIKAHAAKFKELTGVEAELIGMQNIW